MTESAQDTRISVLLSLMRALWGEVLPDLRGITMHLTVEVGTAPQVRCRFLYEGQVGDLQHDCMTTAEAELVSDFPDDMSIEFVAVDNATLDLESDEEWVYLRWEPYDAEPEPGPGTSGLRGRAAWRTWLRRD